MSSYPNGIMIFLSPDFFCIFVYMFTRDEILQRVGVHVNELGIKHISDMLVEIQDRIYSCVRDIKYYNESEYIKKMAGKRNSKFVELCAEEKWEDANMIADNMNKQILTTPLFKEFIKEIKSSSDYIQIVRDMKLKVISS